MNIWDQLKPVSATPNNKNQIYLKYWAQCLTHTKPLPKYTCAHAQPIPHRTLVWLFLVSKAVRLQTKLYNSSLMSAKVFTRCQRKKNHQQQPIATISIILIITKVIYPSEKKLPLPAKYEDWDTLAWGNWVSNTRKTLIVDDIIYNHQNLAVVIQAYHSCCVSITVKIICIPITK